MGDKGMLAGVRVLDFSAMMSGPYCTRLMADLGAEVIKVEPPEGDHMRLRPPLRNGRSAYFAQLNCGKKSIALDLKKPAARELVIALAARCDVVVENFRPGVMQRLGLEYETLEGSNPRLVYCSISGFGQTGSWAARSAYAPVLHAVSGFDVANLMYQGGSERPLKTGIFVADVLGGALAFGAIQAALYRAVRTGRGEYIDLSLMDAMMSMLVYECQEAQFPAERRRPVYEPMRTKDEFVLVAPVSQKNFEALARAVGRPEWTADPRFATVAAREHYWSELLQLLEAWAAGRSAEECEAVLTAAGVPCSRYFSVRQAMDLPPVRERASFRTINDGAGPLRVPEPPFRFSRGAASAGGWVPELGEHGAEIVSRLLGYSDSQVMALRREGVLHQAVGPVGAAVEQVAAAESDGPV